MASPDLLQPPPPLRDLLRSGPVALFLDFDGTLVEIAPEPGAITVPGDLAERLHDLRDRLDGRLALISGRALDDLCNHLGDVSLCRAGSHGASRMLANGARLGEEPIGLPDAAIDELQCFAQDRGLFYETKLHGGALHFRGKPDLRDSVMVFADQVAERHELCVTSGKGVAELVQPGANKGGAVAAFMGEAPFKGAMPIFIGDDVTDEDGFSGATEFGGFGVAVGDRVSDKARYHLDTVSAVHEWLDL